jgi:hypothetical protein
MTDDERARPWPLAVPDVEVRVADPARRHPDEDLAGPRFVERDGLDRDGLARSFKDGGPRHDTIAA